MFAWTESPRGSRPILLHLPHPLPEIPEDPPQPADPRSPDPGGAGADPSRRRRPGTLLPWEGILTTCPGVPGCDEHVWCGHGQKGRAVTSELATFGRDPAEQAGSGGRPSLLALGGAPSLRPCVLPPTGTMLSTGGQYAVKKRRKPVRKRYVGQRGREGAAKPGGTGWVREWGWGSESSRSPQLRTLRVLRGLRADFICLGRTDFILESLLPPLTPLLGF